MAGQYEEYFLQPDVSMTPGSGCFAMAQTERQTDGHGESMTDLAQGAESVKIHSEKIFFFF